MTTFEMEPVINKALKLLHSTAKDSTDEIMHLLEELIDQRYGGTKTLNLKSGTLNEEPAKPLDAPKVTRLSRGSSPAQSSTAGQTSEKSSRGSSPPSEPVSLRTTPDLDDGDLALEIFEDDLNCKICKGMSVGPRNKLVECSDCHSLYHQECHKPPISENVNDPRLVWYCSSCTKTQEKVQSKVKSVHQIESIHKKPKTESSSESKSNSAFKRNEKGSSSSHGKSASGSGMAHLAASLHGFKSSSLNSGSSSKHHSSSSTGNKSSTSLNYSKTPSSPNQKSQSGPAPAPANIIAADKRLQNMKKKAAAKMQEKRSKHK